MEKSYDVVVIGGGAAGLSAALALSRARRAVLVVDSGSPRNARAGHIHNYLGAEGSPPAELLATGRAEVAGYGGEVVSGTVTAATVREGVGFEVALADGSTLDTRRLLITTGLVDDLPDLPGLAQRWGRDVLHCPYCHGWEVRDQALAILGTGPLAVHQAQMFRQWSPDVTLFLHTAGQPTAEEREQLAARGVGVVEGEVAAVELSDDRITGLRLDSGEVMPCQAVVVSPRFSPGAADLLATIGLETARMEIAEQLVGTYIAAEESGATAVPGVWVAGNVADPRATVISSAARGLEVAAMLNFDLITEDTQQAVTAQRRSQSEPAEQFWNDFYCREERVWSGNPNPALVREAAELTPGTALDLGCGEGADAIWLAQGGWRVTGVDISKVALDRAAEHAVTSGVADRIEWQLHDLGVSFPAGTYDLVCAQFLHSYLDMPREEILRAAVAAVSPGGVLLLVGHLASASMDPHHDHPHLDEHLPSPKAVLDGLSLTDGQWELLRSDEHEYSSTDSNGQPTTRTNYTIKLQRRTA